MAVSYETFFGGASAMVVGAGTNDLVSARRVIAVDPQAAGVVLRLPPANVPPLMPGGPAWTIMNLSGSHAVNVVDAEDGAVGTIAAGKTATIVLVSRETAAGDWYLGVKPN